MRFASRLFVLAARCADASLRSRSFLDWRGRRQFCKSVAGSLQLPRELPLPAADDDEMPWPRGVRFYAGVPLASPSGVVVGALSVLDSRPDARLSADKQALLRRLARQAVCLLELRRATAELGAGREALLAAARDRDRLRAGRDAKARELLALRWQFARLVGEEVAAPLKAIADAAHGLALADTPPTHAVLDDVAARLTHLQLRVTAVLDDASGEEPAVAAEAADVRRSVLAPVLLLARHAHGSAAGGGARLLRSVGAGVPQRVVCDAPRVVAVLSKLLDNALKHARPDGSGAVTLAARVDAGALCFSVYDDGRGIAPDAFATLFSRGGLAKAAAMAAAMDGELRAFSDGIDAGSTFTLRLPLALPPGAPQPPLPPEERTLVCRIGTAVAPATPRQPDAPPARLKPGQRSDGTPLRILVAEDDRVSQVIVRKLLVHVGALVTLVGDGNAAIAAWCAAPASFDLMLLDMNMPNCDGPSAARALIEAGCRTPMVALTAHAGASSVRRCLAAGMVGHLSKPVRPETLSTLRPFAEGREPTQEDTDAMREWMAAEAASAA